MGQELALPQAFQGRAMAGAFASALNAQDDNLAEGIGQSYGVISYKGKVWSIRYRGERKSVLRPDDGTPASYLDVIILGQAKTKSKSYYKAFDVNQSEGERPICSSIDGVLPDPDAAIKQCDTCALCPRNAWKTQPNGKKGRECTDYKRLAVLVLPTQTKPTFGQPLMEPLFLRVPPDSLNSVAIMGETMSNQGFHYASYITRITFDPQKAHPCMVFRPLQPLTDGEAPVILELTKDPLVERITHGDNTAREAGAAAVGKALGLAAPGSAPSGLTAAAIGTQNSQPSPALTPAPQQLQQQPATTQTAQPAPQSSGLAQAAMAAASQTASSLQNLGAAPPATPAPTTSTGLTETSTGLVSAASGAALAAPPSSQTHTGSGSATGGAGLTTGLATGAAAGTVADTGPAEASDEELDAKIAALIAPK